MADDLPDGDEVAQMLTDILNGKPFSGPDSWKPTWDEIAAQVQTAPEGRVIDIPISTPEPAPKA